MSELYRYSYLCNNWQNYFSKVFENYNKLIIDYLLNKTNEIVNDLIHILQKFLRVY